MPTYVTFVNFTEDGLEDIAELPEHVEKIEELKRSLGGIPQGFFLTSGQYDMTAFSAMPDDESTAKMQLTSAIQGKPETQMLRAFMMDELRDILDDMSGPAD